MRINKKAQFFNIGVVLFLMVIMAFAYIKYQEKYDSFDVKLGKRQSALISAYEKADQVDFYLDQALRFSTYNGLGELGRSGGFYESECGKYLHYNLWEANNLECYPDQKRISKGFTNILNEEVNQYSTSYGEVIPLNNYEAVIETGDKSNFSAYSTQPVLFDIFPEKEILHNKVLGIPVPWSTYEINYYRLGIYALKNDYKNEININLGVFDIIVEKAKQLKNKILELEQAGKGFLESVELAKQQLGLKDQVSLAQLGITSWEDSCGNPNLQVFDAFVQDIESCYNSYHDNCTCTLNPVAKLPEGEYEIEIKSENNKMVARILLKEQRVGGFGSGYNSRLKIEKEFDFNGPYLTEDAEDFDIDNVDYYQTYTNGRYSLGELEWGIWDWKIPKVNGVPIGAKMYKLNGQLAFIDTDQYSDFEKYDVCRIAPSRYVTNCVSIDSRIPTSLETETGGYEIASECCNATPFDTSDSLYYFTDVDSCGRVGTRDVTRYSVVGYRNCTNYDNLKEENFTVRFALQIPDSVEPPPVEIVKIEDNKKNEGSVVVVWNQSKANDVAFYTIYYSKSDFSNNYLNTLPANEKVELKDKLPIVKQDIDYSCIEENCYVCKHKFSGEDDNSAAELQPNSYYYLRDKKQYLYVLPIPDDVDYNIAVTATDSYGNEIDTISQNRVDYKQGKSLDDLPPFMVSTINLFDGNLEWNQVNGADHYYVYYSQGRILDPNSINDVEDKEFLYSSSNVYKYIREDIEFYTGDPANPIANDVPYYVAVVALDKKGNFCKDIQIEYLTT